MRTKIISLFVFTAIYSSCSAQKLTKIEFLSLKDIIGNFLSSYDSVYFEGRQSELATIILKIDSSGKVTNIHLLGNNNDTVYAILKKMTGEDLKNWQCLHCKNKTLVLPYFYLSGNSKRNYIDELWNDFFSDKKLTYINKNTEFSKEIRNFIITYVMYWVAPGKPMNQ